MRGWREQYEHGQEGELAFDRMLQRAGCVTNPLYQYEKKGAPVLFALDGPNEQLKRMVQPDILAWPPNMSPRFFELKRKTRWVRFGHPDWPGRDIETGFNQNHFNDYLAIEERTGTPIFPAFIQENEEPTGVYSNRLSVLKQNARYWDGRTPKGERVTDPEVFFERRALYRVCDISALKLRPTAQLELAWRATNGTLQGLFKRAEADMAAVRAAKLKPPVDRNRKPLLPQREQLGFAGLDPDPKRNLRR